MPVLARLQRNVNSGRGRGTGSRVSIDRNFVNQGAVSCVFILRSVSGAFWFWSPFLLHFFCFRVRDGGFSNSHCCVCGRSHLCNNIRASGHLPAKEAGSQLD